MAVSFIVGGNQITQRKPPTSSKSLPDFITLYGKRQYQKENEYTNDSYINIFYPLIFFNRNIGNFGKNQAFFMFEIGQNIRHWLFNPWPVYTLC